LAASLEEWFAFLESVKGVRLRGGGVDFAGSSPLIFPGRGWGEIAAKTVVQFLFSTGKSFTVDGLREKLQEFYREEVRAENVGGGGTQ
jgi:hypothetical protein